MGTIGEHAIVSLHQQKYLIVFDEKTYNQSYQAMQLRVLWLNFLFFLAQEILEAQLQKPYELDKEWLLNKGKLDQWIGDVHISLTRCKKKLGRRALDFLYRQAKRDMK